MLKKRIFAEGVLRIKIDDAHAFVMRSKPSYIETDLYRWGYGRGWEGLSLRVWARLARSAMTVVDVGAFRGVYALAAKAMNHQAHVIAFEPVASSCERLVENVQLNGFDIDVCPVAVSDRTGRAVLYRAIKRNQALSSLSRQPNVASEEVEVPITRLDDFVEEAGLGSVDLIKIDVEGHEVAVLTGMTGILEQSRPTLIVEILSEEVGATVLAMLAPLGYHAHLISEYDGLEPISAVGPNVRGSRNFLFCRPDVFEAAQLSTLLVAD